MSLKHEVKGSNPFELVNKSNMKFSMKNGYNINIGDIVYFKGSYRHIVGFVVNKNNTHFFVKWMDDNKVIRYSLYAYYSHWKHQKIKHQ